MIVLNLTAFLSLRTSNCSLRFWASKFPKLPVTKPASQSHRLLSLLLSVPHTSFVKAEEGLPLDRSMTGPRSHTEGVAESALDNPSVAPEQMAPSLSRAPTLVAHITSLDEAPGLHQQHHVSPLQVYSVRWVHSSRVVWLSTPRMHLCSRWLATSASTAARGSSRR